MASLIDISGLTLNPEEASEIGKLIIEKGFVQGSLSDNHDIETGITHDMQIPFAGRIADSLKLSTGCTPNPGGGVKMTEKFWNPKMYDSRWEHCAADLNKLFKLFQKARRVNPDFYDRIDSQEMGVIYALIEQMLTETLPIKVWFSDTSAADVAGGGDFANGTDLALFNVIDGLFKQIFADASIERVIIAENAGATYTAQTLPADKALEYFNQITCNADARLAQDTGGRILATRSLVDNYRKTLRDKNLGAGFLEVVENGRPQLLFDGIPVITMHEWDRTIKSVFDDGTKQVMPHRAVYTTPENIPVGTTSVEDLTNLESFYDQYRKSNVIDVAFTLDAKFLESYMATVAY